jgi:hypothetical protein
MHASRLTLEAFSTPFAVLGEPAAHRRFVNMTQKSEKGMKCARCGTDATRVGEF